MKEKVDKEKAAIRKSRSKENTQPNNTSMMHGSTSTSALNFGTVSDMNDLAQPSLSTTSSYSSVYNTTSGSKQPLESIQLSTANENADDFLKVAVRLVEGDHFFP